MHDVPLLLQRTPLVQREVLATANFLFLDHILIKEKTSAMPISLDTYLAHILGFKKLI